MQDFPLLLTGYDLQPQRVDSFIALGSNLGHPLAQLARAFQALDHLPHTRVLRVSQLYANPPMGPQDQPDYVNAVALLSTRLAPLDLLDALKALEHAAGRFATRHWGARVLDLDILTYGTETIDSATLTIPHPGISDRRFVLAPWAEIAPQIALPDGRRIADLLAAAPNHPLRVIPVQSAVDSNDRPSY
ncbi:MAG TPA: 2-amino-4-hydroxy-6-hydroxymethyldihydropteridine diphosphokinase [Halothiobacillus sp.]|nr:MAG: 2-amino-4-hydroxy-6-hydroxymethyldihydropteridine diphosphokinase [Halothiobacillus sp. 20-54-6]HQT42816.1 2-amino-4-hydroxy-6-hydroxymethyldihydropteridine diphosphokinase [Halothiobacillus sp.]